RARGPTFVDKPVVRSGQRQILFDLPEGAGGTDAGPMSDHRTGSPNRRRRGRKAGETEGAGAAATRPGLLGSGVGVTVRYGSFGRFGVRREPDSLPNAQALRWPAAVSPR